MPWSTTNCQTDAYVFFFYVRCPRLTVFKNLLRTATGTRELLVIDTTKGASGWGYQATDVHIIKTCTSYNCARNRKKTLRERPAWKSVDIAGSVKRGDGARTHEDTLYRRTGHNDSFGRHVARQATTLLRRSTTHRVCVLTILMIPRHTPGLLYIGI